MPWWGLVKTWFASSPRSQGGRPCSGSRRWLSLESLENRQLLAAGPIAIGDGEAVSWTDALRQNLIRPVDPFAGDKFTTVSRQFFQQQGLPFGMTRSQLDVDVSITLPSESHSSLLARWRSDSAVTGLSVAAWQYDYQDELADLTQSSLKFSLGVPQPANALPGNSMAAVRDASVELIDVAGNSRGWFITEPEIGWSEYQVRLDVPVSTLPFKFIDTAGFDISQVASIRLAAASTSVEFPTLPHPADDGLVSWTAWNHLRVIPATGSIVHGAKFHDLNANGLRDAQEPGLADWQIVLTETDIHGISASRTVVTQHDDPTTQSDETGHYLFDQLTAGTYRIEEVITGPPDATVPWHASAPAAGYHPINLSENVTIGHLDFGNYQFGSALGSVWHDLNGDGDRDPHESGLTDWKILVSGTSGTGQSVQKSVPTQTDTPGTPAVETGSFFVSDLIPGRYSAKPVVPIGWSVSFPRVGVHDVKVESGQAVVARDFGVLIPGTVSGRKYLDLDGNGAKDVGEPGLAGWQILVQGVDNRGVSVARSVVTQSDNPLTTEDEAGTYQLANIWPGRYKVSEVSQIGWGQSAPSVGSYSFGLESGQSQSGLDFGNFVFGSVNGVKYEDFNGNGQRDPDERGLAGFEVVLTRLSGETRTTVSRADDPRTPSDETGQYSFGSLAPGDYQVSERPRDHWHQSQPDATYAAHLISGQSIRNLDFGNFQTIIVEGRTRLDLNTLGQSEPWEPGLGDWTILLDGTDGKGNAVHRSVVTRHELPETDFDEGGLYVFANLAPGEYQLTEIVPAGWTQTGPLGGGYAIQAVSGEILVGRNFLNQSPYRCDLNGDAEVDAADMGILFARWGELGGWGNLDRDPMIDAADAGLCFTEWTGSRGTTPRPLANSDSR